MADRFVGLGRRGSAYAVSNLHNHYVECIFLRMLLNLPSRFANVNVRAEATAVITSMLKI